MWKNVLFMKSWKMSYLYLLEKCPTYKYWKNVPLMISWKNVPLIKSWKNVLIIKSYKSSLKIDILQLRIQQ